MSEHTCKYHPLASARWACAQCDVDFCNQCVTKDSIKNRAMCPLCKNQLDQVEASNFIVPYWERIPQFFKYPLNVSTIVMMAGGAMIFTGSMFFGMFGAIFLIFLGLAFLRYLMAVLSETAQGRLRPVNFSVDMMSEGFTLPFKLLGIFLSVICLSWYLLLNGHVGLFRLLQITFAVTLPAQIMILATEESFFKAINPVYVFDTIRRIPIAYVGLLIFLTLLQVSSELIQGFLASQRSFALYPVFLFVSMYFSVVMFNMMGYVVFQYHEVLDYHVRLDVDDDNVGSGKQAVQTPVNPELAAIEVLVREDRVDDAIKELTRLVNQNPLQADMNNYLFKLLKTHNRSEQLVQFADHYINVLFNQGDKARAVNVCQEVMSVDPSYRIGNPDVYLEVVRMLKARMAGKQAVALCNGFHKRYPEHHSIPELYFEVAQILAENLNNDKQAIQVLSYIAQNYPQHDILPQVREYLVVLHKMRKQA